MAIVFGLAKYKNAVSGLHLQSVTYGETASSSDSLDESGNIEQVDIYGKKRTIQCEGNVVEGGDLAALTVGATLTVDSIAYKIDSISIKEAVNAQKTATISGSAPIAAAAPAQG